MATENGNDDPVTLAETTEVAETEVTDVKGKGKAVATEELEDTSMVSVEEDDEDDDEDDDVDEEDAEVEEDNLEEIDPENIVGRRTRGKVIDFAKAAQENPPEDDDDDEEDEDFHVDEDKMDED